MGLKVSAAVLLEVAARLVRRLSRYASDRADADERVGGVAWSGLTRLVRSPYLLGIAGYVLLFTMVTTFLYFEKMRIVDASIVGRDERTSVFALIELGAQVATILLQLFLTGRLMRWLGMGAMLCVVPVVFIVGFAALDAVPTLGVIALIETGRRAGNLALSRPARETLFTVVTRDDKYKAKCVIDTFVYRGGDVVGTFADKAVAALGAPVAVAAIPLGGLGVALAFWLGWRERRRATAALPPDSARDTPLSPDLSLGGRQK